MKAQPMNSTTQRVRLIRDVDRYPYFIARKGQTGEYLGHRMGVDAVRLDAHLEGAEEWGNAVLWDNECDHGAMEDDIEFLTPVEIASIQLLTP